MAAAIRDPDPVIFCEHEGAVRDQGRGARRRARRAARQGGHRPRGRRTARSSRSRRWSRGPSRPPTAWRPSRASRPRSSTCGRSSRSTSPRSSRSVEKTSRLFTVEENPRLCGWGAEIVSIVADEGFYSLDAPIVRITTPHVPLAAAAGRSRTRRCRPSSGSSTPSSAGSRTRSDGRRRARPSASSARGGWARRWRARWRAPAATLVLHNRTAERAEALAAELGARVAAIAARGRRDGRRRAHDARRRRRGAPTSTAAADGLLAGRPPRARCSSTCRTVTPDALRAFDADVRAAGVGLLDAPVSAASTATAESGPADAHGRRRRPPTSSARGRRWSRWRRRSSTSGRWAPAPP